MLFSDFLLVRVSPSLHRFDNRAQAGPKRRQRVLDFRRHLRVDLAQNQAIGFHLTQFLREHLGGDAAACEGVDDAPQLGETQRLIKKTMQDDDLPAPRHQLQSPFGGTSRDRCSHCACSFRSI